MSVRPEVLAANDAYAASFGQKSPSPSHRPVISPSSPAWMLAWIPPSTQGWPRATPT